MFDTGVGVGGPFGTPAQRLAWVLEQPPSGETHAVLTSLGSASLTSAERMLVAKAWDRQLSAVTAQAMTAQVAATTAATSVAGEVAPPVLLDGELALMLRRTDDEMAAQLSDARAITRLPVIFDLLRTGA